MTKRVTHLIILTAIIFSQAAFAQAENERIPKESHQYHKGSKGGCYYLTISSKKVYVDRKLCN